MELSTQAYSVGLLFDSRHAARMRFVEAVLVFAIAAALVCIITTSTIYTFARLKLCELRTKTLALQCLHDGVSNSILVTPKVNALIMHRRLELVVRAGVANLLIPCANIFHP